MITIAACAYGLVVSLQLKYGPIVQDTGTVVMKDEQSIYVTHRDRPTSIYLLETSILRIEKIQ